MRAANAAFDPEWSSFTYGIEREWKERTGFENIFSRQRSARFERGPPGQGALHAHR
jgi:hypothetical protein